MTALDAALAYAARGWPVFPCLPGRKVPATRHGFQDASTDTDQLRSWWSRDPTANVAVATGHPGPDVLDIDVKKVDGMATLERLRRTGLVAGPTALVTTPSGGLHLYFAGTSEGNHALARHGIDLRATGGYVLAPPSTVDGNPYRLTDARPATGARLDWARLARFLDPPHRHVPQRPDGAGSDNIGHLVRWVSTLAEGNRNNGLHWAACRAVETGHDPAPLIDAAVAAGLPDHEARATVASALRTGALARVR